MMYTHGMSNKLPTWVRSKLKERGWSQRELARQCGLSNTTISKVLTGSLQPSRDFCHAMADAFGVSYGDVAALAGLESPTPLSESPTLDPYIASIIEAAAALPEEKRAEAVYLLKALKDRPIIIYGGKP